MCLNAYYYYNTWFSNYTYLDNVYFAFVTMSTIGFGDMVMDIYFMESLSSTMQVLIYLVDPIVFYINFSLLASIIGSIVADETDRPDEDNEDKSKNM